MKNGIVRISNSDPEMLKVFQLFLKRALKVPNEKIIAKLILYPDLEDKFYKPYWGRQLDIKLTQFRKSVVIQGKHPTRRLSYGVCSLEVYSRKLKEKIFTWLKLYQDYVSVNESYVV